MPPKRPLLNKRKKRIPPAPQETQLPPPPPPPPPSDDVNNDDVNNPEQEESEMEDDVTTVVSSVSSQGSSTSESSDSSGDKRIMVFESDEDSPPRRRQRTTGASETIVLDEAQLEQFIETLLTKGGRKSVVASAEGSSDEDKLRYEEASKRFTKKRFLASLRRKNRQLAPKAVSEIEKLVDQVIVNGLDVNALATANIDPKIKLVLLEKHEKILERLDCASFTDLVKYNDEMQNLRLFFETLKYRTVTWETYFGDYTMSDDVVAVGMLLHEVPRPYWERTIRNYDKVLQAFASKRIQLSSILNEDRLSGAEKLSLFERYCTSMEALADDNKRVYRHSIEAIGNDIRNKTSAVFREEVNFDDVSSVKACVNGLNVSDGFKKYIVSFYTSHTDRDSSDFTKARNWLKFVVNFPFGVTKPLTTEKERNAGKFAMHVKSVLDRELYGMTKVKEEFLSMAVQKYLNPKSEVMIGLWGKPGVGKTAIVDAFAKALDVPYKIINMGGVSNAETLLGHSFTYVGSQAGKIAVAMSEMKRSDGMILFDEIDKTGSHRGDGGSDVASTMMAVTDYTQNHCFGDEYMSPITIDLSKLWFMFTMNHKEVINPTLLDRIHVIRVDDYKDEDKVKILSQYMIPKIAKSIGLDMTKLEVGDDVVTYIIGKMGKESGGGLRPMKKFIESLLRKMLLVISTNNEVDVSYKVKNFSIPYRVKKEDVENMMEKKEKEVLTYFM